MNSHGSQIILVADLPALVQRELRTTLTNNKKWEILAENYLEFKRDDMETLSMAKDPMTAVLTKCRHRNLKTDRLFTYLFKMQHYEAASLLLPFLPEKFTAALNTAPGSLQRLLLSENTSDSKDLQIARQNFNHSDTSKIVDKRIDKITDPHNDVNSNTAPKTSSPVSTYKTSNKVALVVPSENHYSRCKGQMQNY